MITETTIDSINESGYKSWLDFAMSIQSISFGNNICIYVYRNSEGRTATVNLNINSTTIDRLALEESRLILPLIKFPSFTELLNRIEEENRFRLEYVSELIYKNHMDQVSFKRISIKLQEIEKLASIEKSNKDYLIFHEEKFQLKK